MSFRCLASRGGALVGRTVWKYNHPSPASPIQTIVASSPTGRTGTTGGIWSPLVSSGSSPSSVVSVITRTFATKKKKNLLQHAKGFRGRSKNCFRVAIRRLHKAWTYSYRDRKVKRREWSKLWIQRISAGVRQYGFSYSQFMGWYNKPHQKVKLDRKILAELAAQEPFAFRSVVQVVEASNGKQQQA